MRKLEIIHLGYIQLSTAEIFAFNTIKSNMNSVAVFISCKVKITNKMSMHYILEIPCNVLYSSNYNKVRKTFMTRSFLSASTLHFFLH